MPGKSSAALLAVVLGFGANAFASDFAYPVANEIGTAYRGAEYAVRGGSLVRVDDLNVESGPASRPADANGGFTFRGDGIGWEVTPHQFVASARGLAHSDACDHAIRTAVAPTPAEIDKARMQSPGA